MPLNLFSGMYTPDATLNYTELEIETMKQTVAWLSYNQWGLCNVYSFSHIYEPELMDEG